MGACASDRGWERIDERACAPASPPIVCLDALPDRGIELRIGDRPLLPRECMRAPERARGGSLRTTLIDEHGTTKTRRIAVRRDRITFIVVDDRARITVTDRHPCDATIPPQYDLRPDD